MARPDISDVRELTEEQIDERIDGLRRELFDLRFQRATRRLEHPHRFKEVRIKLAQLLTVRSQRQRTSAT
jgi:large subunit ribosomal protein L29